MAFGFLKKKEKADMIFRNGTIYTASAEDPWVDAVAVRDGIIIAVGDEESIMELAGDDTEITDLRGRTMVPGFIETCGAPSRRAFSGTYPKIPDTYDLDAVLGFVSDMVSEEARDAYFAAGFNEEILKDIEEDKRREVLDGICPDRPLVLISERGKVIWINTKANETIINAAKEDGVHRIGIPYIVEVFGFFDFDEIEENFIENSEHYSELGVTTIVDTGSPDYFDNVYQDMLLTAQSNGKLQQRFFGTLYIDRKIPVENVITKLRAKKTHLMEVPFGIEFNKLHVDLTKYGKFDIGEETDDYLDGLVKGAADAGFDIHFVTDDETATMAAVSAMSEAVNAGYRKNIYSIAIEGDIDRSGLNDTMLGEEITETYNFRDCLEGKPVLSLSETENPAKRSIEEFVDKLTIDAALLIGKEDEIGSIEEGKAADFAVFDENPFELKNVGSFRRMIAVMTVVNGEIVYDVDSENMDEWYEIMSGMYV